MSTYINYASIVVANSDTYLWVIMWSAHASCLYVLMVCL